MLELSGLNYWAVIVAWLINMVVGSVWYSPVGFGKLWSQLSGVDMMKIPKNEANRAIGVVAVASLLQAAVLAVILNSLAVLTAGEGLWVAVVLWLGLVAATTIANTLYQRLSWKFWWLNASFFLIVMAINGLILAVWH